VTGGQASSIHKIDALKLDRYNSYLYTPAEESLCVRRTPTHAQVLWVQADVGGEGHNMRVKSATAVVFMRPKRHSDGIQMALRAGREGRT
jgi:hypothetical protein